jgi:dienelactone hydrolase
MNDIHGGAFPLPAHRLEQQVVPYRDGSTPLTGVLVWDDALTGPRPGVPVVHGGAGLDDHARGRARRLAEFGYVVLASDMYGDGVAGDRQRVMAQIAQLTADHHHLRQRAQAGVEVLAAHPLVDGRLAAVGYCFGGMTVLELARGGSPIAGVASLHGSLETTHPAKPGTITTTILVIHGASDPHVPLTHVTRFTDEMNHAGADWQLIICGGAQHGFTHDVQFSVRVPGVAYHPSRMRAPRTR